MFGNNEISLTIIAALISAISTLLSALLSRYTRIKKIKVKDFEIHLVDDGSGINYGEDSRINDAKQYLAEQELKSKLYRYASILLIFGQYVIGAVLASSFIQETVSPKLFGILGILVIISTQFNQRYRPDILYRGAQRRIYQLKRLIRISEDMVFALQNEPEKALKLHLIRSFVTNGLNEVDATELGDTEGEYVSDQQRNQPSPRNSV